MKYRVMILATACLVLMGYFAVNTQAQGHTIRGKVRNSGGTNVSRVSITLERNGALIDQTVSNNEGDFTFTGLTDTSYTIVASAQGYNGVRESVDFVRATGTDQPGETRTVEMTLVPVGGVRAPRPGLSVFTTQSATAVLEHIRDQIKGANPDPVSFNLAANGVR